MEPLLSVQNLETAFFNKQGKTTALHQISYDIFKGEVLGIVGESGCGKSLTSLSLMGLIEPPGRVTQGKVLFQGQDLLKLPTEEREALRGNKMAMIFQEPMTALNPVLTVGQQIDEQLLRHRSISPEEAHERSVEMLHLVGIPSPSERYHNYPHQLSGGMRQRAMIAMALSCNPDFLIADEPTTALDVTIQAQILELIQSLQEKMQMTVQFITHDLGVISEIADRVMVMYAGHICEIATADTLFSSPQHPYTQALLQSIPQIGRKQKRLSTIEGQVPALSELPQGCPFQNRCPSASNHCQNSPSLKEGDTGHFVACFAPGSGGLDE